MDELDNILGFYLLDYEYGIVQNGKLQDGSFLRTTEIISRALSDMIDFEDNDLVSCLISRGYKVVYLQDGRHGWLLKHKDK